MLRGRTDGKHFYPSIPQALCGGDHVVLRLPISEEDGDLGDAGPGSRFRLEAALQDEGQSETWNRM